MVDNKKEKLINSIIFFTKRTKNCGKTKLFKLLYFLDFIGFKKYGSTVTGLEYYAWKYGPVPQKLYHDFTNEEDEKQYFEYFKIIKLQDEENPGEYQFKIHPLKKFNKKVFKPRELEILENVSFIFKNTRAVDISEITHLKNTPWSKTKEQKGLNEHIDYELAIDEETEIPIEIIRERYNNEKELRNYL